MQKRKGKTELLLEAYLNQENIAFEYEPFGPTQSNPDYRIQIKNSTLLIEVEEIAETPFDKVCKEKHKAGIKTWVGTLDARALYDAIRKKVFKASKQLKGHQDKVDYCLVVIGKRSEAFTQEISLETLFWAMYGDPYLSIPVNVETGIGEASRAEPRLKMTGSFRRNDPKTRTPVYRHAYISGVGFVREFSTSVPPRSLYGLHLISNSLSERPLPEGIFLGQRDSIIIPH